MAQRRVSTARIAGGPLLRLRSDEQLVRLFRAGNEDAFRAIHERYRTRLFAYARQMLAGSRQDAEDALQDVFVRAYAALRANDRDVSLRAWLYRVAHNRCIDELRRPSPPPPEALELVRPPASDPIAATEQRESLRRLVADIERLPEQQRSALLLREISGMSYDELATALGVTVPAIKSLLVRARIGLVQAAEARDTACAEIRASLADAHERGVRATGLARRHLQDCDGCRAYRRELRATGERIAALVPALGPGALLAKLLGLGGGAAGGASALTGGGTAGAGAAAIGGGTLGVSASQVVAVVAVTAVSAGGAVEVGRTIQAQRGHDAPPAATVRHVPPVTATPLVTPAGPVVAATHADTARGRVVRIRTVAAPVAAVPVAAPSVPAPASADPSVATGPSNGGAAPPPELVEPAPAEPPVAQEPAPPGAPPADGDAEPAPPVAGAGTSTTPPPPSPAGGASSTTP